VESRIKVAKDRHNGNLNSCIKYSSLTALMTEAVKEATPPSRCNSRKQWLTDPTPPRKLLPPFPLWNAECDKLKECVKQPSGSSRIGAQERTLLVTIRQKPMPEMS
jgi:hypothetical protein